MMDEVFGIQHVTHCAVMPAAGRGGCGVRCSRRCWFANRGHCRMIIGSE